MEQSVSKCILGIYVSSSFNRWAIYFIKVGLLNFVVGGENQNGQKQIILKSQKVDVGVNQKKK